MAARGDTEQVPLVTQDSTDYPPAQVGDPAVLTPAQPVGTPGTMTPSQILQLKQSMKAFGGYTGNVASPEIDEGFLEALNVWRTKFGLPTGAAGVTQADMDKLDDNLSFFRQQQLSADPYYASDPAHAAFMRQSLFGIDQKRAEVARQQDRYYRNMEQLVPQFDLQRDQSTRNVNQGYEDRGFFRSGARGSELAEKIGIIDRSQQMAEQSIYDQLDDVNYGLSNYIAQQHFGQSESQLEARQRAAEGL